MKKNVTSYSLLVLLVLLPIGIYWYYSPSGIKLRNQYYSSPPELQKLLKRFQRLQMEYAENPPALPLVYAQQNPAQFSVALADKPLGLYKSEVVLRNPFAKAPYPLSFSVVYRGNLITLFAPGYFACYQLPGMARNLPLEKQLNTRKFDYHWVLNGQLVALYGRRYEVFSDSNSWQPYARPIPLNKQPKLFEDARYIVCAKCNGEWGGEVYFYDKKKQLYYIAEATCANSIVKQGNAYLVVSSLSHMDGSTEVQQIVNPNGLTRWGGNIKPQDRDFDRTNGSELSHGRRIINYRQLMILAGFKLDNKIIYLVNWRETTFLAIWKNGIFYAVDPLFHDGLFAFNPLTTAYESTTVLMNIDSPEEVETSCLLFTGKQVIKINWSKETVTKEYAVNRIKATDSVTEASELQFIDSVEVQAIE